LLDLIHGLDTYNSLLPNICSDPILKLLLLIMGVSLLFVDCLLFFSEDLPGGTRERTDLLRLNVGILKLIIWPHLRTEDHERGELACAWLTRGLPLRFLPWRSTCGLLLYIVGC
jgi:hypothetical protein